nr:MAG TPA: hypothetical protein [Microviridae sp.]
MFALNIKKRISNCGFDSVFSYGFLLMFFVMEKVPFYRKKSFWTLLISILTALSVYFAASCTRKLVYRSSGVHCDTVQLDVRSNLKLP